MRWLLNISTLDAADGGPAEAVLNIAGELAEVGEEVHVLAFTHPSRTVNAQLDRARSRGVRLHLIRKRRLGRLRPSIRQILAASRLGRDADVITLHAFYQFTAVAAWIAYRTSHRAQLWCVPHGVFDPYQEQVSATAKRRFRRAIGGRILGEVRAFLVASELERRSVSRTIGPHARIVVTGLGTSAPTVAPSDTPGRERSRVTVLFLSRVAPKKRLDLLLDAFVLLDVERPELRLRVCGATDGAYAARLRERYAGLTNVDWVGHVDGPAKTREFHAASVLCLPTESENYGQVITEGMAHELPVITTAQAGASDLVTAADAGWVLDSPTSRELADTIQRGLADQDLDRLGRNGADYAAQHLSWSAVAQRWLREADQPSA